MVHVEMFFTSALLLSLIDHVMSVAFYSFSLTMIDMIHCLYLPEKSSRAMDP